MNTPLAVVYGSNYIPYQPPCRSQIGLFPRLLLRHRSTPALLLLPRCGQSDRLLDAAHTLRSELAGSPWQVAVDEAVDRYDRLVETLREEGVSDLNEYGHLAQDRQRLDGELANLDSLQEEKSRLEEESQALLRTVLEARRDVSAAREHFLTIALTGNPFVRIRNRPYNDDPQAIEISLREELGVTNDRFPDDFVGAVGRLLRHLPEEPTQRNTTVEARIEQLKARVRRACDGNGDFGGHFNNYLERESERNPQFPNFWIAHWHGSRKMDCRSNTAVLATARICSRSPRPRLVNGRLPCLPSSLPTARSRWCSINRRLTWTTNSSTT